MADSFQSDYFEVKFIERESKKLFFKDVDRDNPVLYAYRLQSCSLPNEWQRAWIKPKNQFPSGCNAYKRVNAICIELGVVCCIARAPRCSGALRRHLDFYLYVKYQTAVAVHSFHAKTLTTLSEFSTLTCFFPWIFLIAHEIPELIDKELASCSKID